MQTRADFKFKIQIGEEAEEITKEHSIIEEKAYRDIWGKGLDSYLQMMYERLVLMKELLAENGSIYVHLDWHVGDYVKVMMDEIFGYENFQREIVWDIRVLSGYKTKTNNWIRGHDNILFYSKSSSFTFNRLTVPHDEKYLRRFDKTDESGRRYFDDRGEPRYLDEVIAKGKAIGDVWDDIMSFQQIPTAVERLPFDTQKPEALLKRIILASSNPGDLVADFFCGSGTTLAVAEKLGRRWIGCDLSRYAIHITRKRLLEIENSKDLENEGKKYGKKARPFEILNLGKYERQLWQVKTFTNKDEKQALFEYLTFILKLYGAEPVSGFTYIHGKKSNALVYIGAVDSPVTIQECIEAMKECKSLGQKELHILGWEWEMGLNNAIQEIAKKEGIKLKLRIIPMDVLHPEAVRVGIFNSLNLHILKLR